MEWRSRIESKPEVLGGKPCIAGTRIPVSLVLGYLAAGRSAKEVIEEYPDLKDDDVRACLEYARELAEFQVAS